MAAINTPLIIWFVVVAAMTVLISVSLFYKGPNTIRQQKVVTKRDKLMKYVKF